MPLVETKVETYRVEYICDECKLGKYKSTGVILTSHPPQYPHYCEECGHRKTLTSCYPLHIFKDVI